MHAPHQPAEGVRVLVWVRDALDERRSGGLEGEGADRVLDHRVDGMSELCNRVLVDEPWEQGVSELLVLPLLRSAGTHGWRQVAREGR
jgi:hypothetical protein